MGLPSVTKLVGVHADLVKVVHAAYDIIEASEPVLRFMVTEGLRSIERQRQLVATGASKTMDSRHLTGHAVDLAAVIAGKVAWDWPLYFKIAGVMRQAAIEQGVPIVWGGVFDRTLDQLTPEGGMEDDVAAYIARRKAAGNAHPFTDGPHFELLRSKYPA